MKKIIIASLIVLSVFTMVACNGNGGSAGEDSQENTQGIQQDSN